jgi:dipeptidyl aminopeptidase/acylaminoacyl peptidase
LLTMPPNNVGNGRTEADIAQSNGAKLLGATVRDVPKLARDASALDNVSRGDAPFLIMHGTADKGVPLVQSEKLDAKLRAHGVESTLLALKGAGHGGPEFITPEAKKITLDFFMKHLKR